MDNAIRNSIKENEKVDYYKNKIDNIENNKSISSDDPKAIEKLKHKLKILQEQKQQIKQREHQWYELPYINKEIKRIKDRIQELEELDEINFEDITFKGGKVVHNKEINRVQIVFDTKPNEEIRDILKHSGFKWSRYENAWQRLFNKNSIYVTERVLEQIQKII